MKAKYDIARLHKDCLAWCENPQWKPWMVEDYKIKLVTDGPDYWILRRTCIKAGSQFLVAIGKHTPSIDVLLFGQIIGLDIESYRLPEIDRDQAVRDYLAGIKEGAPLWEGSEWVKKTVVGESVYAYCTKGDLLLIGKLTGIRDCAYTFLRLDLREDKQ